MTPRKSPYPVISIIDFHHARGPEVEHWIGVEDPADISEWPLLPFLALADGAHSSEEDFSFFTLKHNRGREDNPTTLFGISCTRQLDSRELIERPADVTRSTVQKAVVVIADSPTFFFGHLKQQLSAVTQAWFAQRNFEDLDIIRRFQESLQVSMEQHDAERDQYVGLSLREIVHEFRHQTLVLFKCMLLQPKMLFFSQRCEQLCMVQFSLLSLIPGLLRALQDCSDPELNAYEQNLVKPTSVRTSDKKSLLAFMGLPLQIFGKGSLFGPYTPLQQLDILADVGTKSYMVGSTNSLLLQQKDRYSDILINLDEGSVNITSTSLRSALSLTAADRRFIDHLTLAVIDSWDDADPSRPKTMGFIGSEDYIRLQFEEYILSMVSAVKYHMFLEKHAGSATNMLLPDIEGDPSLDFSQEYIEYWQKTDNFRIFQKFTESEIFDIVPPRHVMAGGLSIEDVQRRLAQQVQDLHLDEKVVASREAAAKAIAAGRTNLSSAFMNISKNVERFREQRRLQAEQDAINQLQKPAVEVPPIEKEKAATTPSSPVSSEAPAKTGYMSSWAQWAAEKRKNAFGGTASPPTGEVTPPAEKPATIPTTPAKPSIFSRWSKSSIDIPTADKDKARSASSVEITRDAKWDDSPTKLPGPPKEDKELPMSPVDKSLPELPLDSKKDTQEDTKSPEIHKDKAPMPMPIPTIREPEESIEVEPDVPKPVEKDIIPESPKLAEKAKAFPEASHPVESEPEESEYEESDPTVPAVRKPSEKAMAILGISKPIEDEEEKVNPELPKAAEKTVVIPAASAPEESESEESEVEESEPIIPAVSKPAEQAVAVPEVSKPVKDEEEPTPEFPKAAEKTVVMPAVSAPEESESEESDVEENDPIIPAVPKPAEQAVAVPEVSKPVEEETTPQIPKATEKTEVIPEVSKPEESESDESEFEESVSAIPEIAKVQEPEVKKDIIPEAPKVAEKTAHEVSKPVEEEETTPELPKATEKTEVIPEVSKPEESESDESEFEESLSAISEIPKAQEPEVKKEIIPEAPKVAEKAESIAEPPQAEESESDESEFEESVSAIPVIPKTQEPEVKKEIIPEAPKVAEKAESITEPSQAEESESESEFEESVSAIPIIPKTQEPEVKKEIVPGAPKVEEREAVLEVTKSEEKEEAVPEIPKSTEKEEVASVAPKSEEKIEVSEASKPEPTKQPEAPSHIDESSEDEEARMISRSPSPSPPPSIKEVASPVDAVAPLALKVTPVPAAKPTPVTTSRASISSVESFASAPSAEPEEAALPSVPTVAADPVAEPPAPAPESKPVLNRFSRPALALEPVPMQKSEPAPEAAPVPRAGSIASLKSPVASSPKLPSGSSSPLTSPTARASFERPRLKKPALVSKFEQAAAASPEPSSPVNKRSSLNPPPKRGNRAVGGIAARAAMFEKK